MAKYLAYGCGKGNHSFILKSEGYETLFEGNCLKTGFFTPSKLEFVNAKTNERSEHKVGHTVEKSSGTGMNNSSLRIVTDSYFKLDGVNVFDVLASKGYRLKITSTKLINPEVSLLNGSNAAVAKLTLNVKGPRQENVKGIGGSQRNTVIETESTDFETLFLAAFILSRVSFSKRIS